MERRIQKTKQDLILIRCRTWSLEIVVVADLESHQTNFGSSALGPEEIIIEQDIFSVLVFWTKTWSAGHPLST